MTNERAVTRRAVPGSRSRVAQSSSGQQWDVSVFTVNEKCTDVWKMGKSVEIKQNNKRNDVDHDSQDASMFHNCKHDTDELKTTVHP